MLAACVPEGDDDDARWHERITGEEEFPDFVEKCKDTLLKIDGEILAQKVSEAEKAFSHYKDLVGQIGDDSSEAWEEMGASLRAARISSSAQKLMTAFTDPKNSKPALRAMVRRGGREAPGPQHLQRRLPRSPRREDEDRHKDVVRAGCRMRIGSRFKCFRRWLKQPPLPNLCLDKHDSSHMCVGAFC